jgi:ABC-type Mn2+/Zn2+ transport system permease subunit
MSTFTEILARDFLLRDALIGSVLVGLVCPLVGVYFVLRRMVFLGVALPQVSAAGIACSFFGYRLMMGPHEHGETSERTIALVGSLGFTLFALLFLAALERRAKQSVEVRIGVTYAVAAAATILLLAADPYAEAHLVSLLKGDILATTRSSLALVTGVFGGVVLLLLVFRRELLLVSFDRDMAAVLGFRVRLWDMLLYLLIGITISLGVMTAGPIVTFGFLLLPAVTARLFVRRMLTFSIASSLLGGATAFFGFAAAYRYDLPLGPAEVAIASVILLLAWLVRASTGLAPER